MKYLPSLRGARSATRQSKRCMDCFAALAMTMMLTSCITPTGKQQPAEVVSYGQKGGAGSTGMHTILKDDTVYTVSQRYNLPLREIITLNSLQAPYTLNAGFRLKLPPPNDYKVKPGDTLNGISRMFNASVSEMARLNNLAPPYVIEKGQVIRLPTPQPRLEQSFAVNAPAPTFSVETQTTTPVKVGAVESEELAPPPGQFQTASVSTPANATGTMPPQPTAKAATTTTAAPAAPAAKLQQASASLPSAVAPKVPARSPGKFMRPVDGKVISSFGPKPDGLHNDGINIKAARGTAVRAADNGVVAYVGNEMSGFGNLILIRHADRWMTAYAHMDKVLVKKNDVVKVGQSIGTVGTTGQVDSPQLHFEIRKGTKALDPTSHL